MRSFLGVAEPRRGRIKSVYYPPAIPRRVVSANRTLWSSCHLAFCASVLCRLVPASGPALFTDSSFVDTKQTPSLFPPTPARLIFPCHHRARPGLGPAGFLHWQEKALPVVCDAAMRSREAAAEPLLRRNGNAGEACEVARNDAR